MDQVRRIGDQRLEGAGRADPGAGPLRPIAAAGQRVGGSGYVLDGTRRRLPEPDFDDGIKRVAAHQLIQALIGCIHVQIHGRPARFDQ